MNAAVRSVTITALARGHQVLGIANGYEGLLAGDAQELTLSSVDDITRQGGTMLGSARSRVFPTPEGQAQARRRLGELGLEGLVVIGGNGSLAGAHRLGEARLCPTPLHPDRPSVRLVQPSGELRA